MSQCPNFVDGRQCILNADHGEECYSPNDGLDHSDEIRIRLLRDRCRQMQDARDCAIAHQVDSDKRIRNQRHEISVLTMEIASLNDRLNYFRKRCEDLESADKKTTDETLRKDLQNYGFKYDNLARRVSIAERVLKGSLGEYALKRLDQDAKAEV